jgi:two-component system chemotaxis response regulator CheV
MNDDMNTENMISIVDDHFDDTDELDLLKLVSTNANDTNQYLLFLGSDNQYYAKNVSKIEELLVYKDINIVKNNDSSNYIIGTANIRGKMTSIVSFDNWIGNQVLDEHEYELVIIAAYSGKRFALVVKEVEYIVTIESENMSDNSDDNNKSSFISKVNINGKEQLCTIFDSDLLVMEVFNSIENEQYKNSNKVVAKSQSNKFILFADDSKVTRKLTKKIFKELHYNYKIYKNGKMMIDDIVNMDINDIGLIITDLEMPEVTGRELIEYIRSNNLYNHVNILVHTNVNNDSLERELVSMNVSEIVRKVDMLGLTTAIKKYIS